KISKTEEDYLHKLQPMENYRNQLIRAERLQAVMERMPQHTRRPEMLRELFESLGNDPFVIAECLARPVLSEQLVTSSYGYDQRFHGTAGPLVAAARDSYTLPIISCWP